MKYKYRIVQDGNGEFHIQYCKPKFFAFNENWGKKYISYNTILDTIEKARQHLKEVMQLDQEEENKEILTVVE